MSQLFMYNARAKLRRSLFNFANSVRDVKMLYVVNPPIEAVFFDEIKDCNKKNELAEFYPLKQTLSRVNLMYFLL